MNSYESFALVLDVLRKECVLNGLAEFMPPGTVPGYAHHPHMHATLNVGNQFIILPYQLSLHNRIATHYLNRPSFCVGPCFRNDEESGFHSRCFTQFSFEIFSDSLDKLADLSTSLLNAVLREAGISIETRSLDLLSDERFSDSQVRHFSNTNNCAILIKHKRQGIPPLLNLAIGEDFEEAIEIVLPTVGEVLDGGVRDPEVLTKIYGVTPHIKTVGASFGLDRLVAFLTDAADLTKTCLL